MIRYLLAFLLSTTAAFAQSPFPTTVSQKSVAISISTATTTELVPAVANQSIGITSYNVIAGGSGNIKFVYGSGTACATGTTDLTGTYNLDALSGIAFGAGIGLVLIIPPGKAFCAVTSAAVNMAGSASYVQF